MLWGVTSWVDVRPRPRTDYVLVNRDHQWRHELYMNVLGSNRSYPWVTRLTPVITLPINVDMGPPRMNNSFKSFIDNHSTIPIINAFGVYVPEVNRFLTHLAIPHLPKPIEKHVLCGGVINGRANTRKTTRCIQNLTGRGKCLFILSKCDVEVLKWLGLPGDMVPQRIGKGDWSVDLKQDMVFIHHGMLTRWRDILSVIEWNHVVMDMVIDLTEWKTKCLWIITDFETLKPKDMGAMFRLNKVFGLKEDMEESMLKSTLGNYVTFTCGSEHTSNRPNWSILECDARFTDHYPLGRIFRSPVSLKTMLAMEYDEVDEYALSVGLYNRRFHVKDTGFREMTCGICFEETFYAVKNQCNHWFCDTCTYRVAMSFGKCPLCRREYDFGAFEGFSTHKYPKQLTRYVRKDLTHVLDRIDRARSSVLLLIHPNDVHEMLYVVQYRFPQRVVTVNGIGDIMLVTPLYLQQLRYILNPKMVICLTLRVESISVLDWCFHCPVLFAVPQQSMTTALIDSWFQSQEKISDEELWLQFKEQFDE